MVDCASFHKTDSQEPIPLAVAGNYLARKKGGGVPCFLKTLQCMVNDLKEQKILEVFKIPFTRNRSVVLSLILPKGEKAFSMGEIVEEMGKCRYATMPKTSIANILRLFTVRGLLKNVDPEKTLARGRPQVLFVLSPQALESLYVLRRTND